MYEIQGLIFKQTCAACPEQYDVFDKDAKEIGYVRLRWGELYAECPYGGDVVYEASVGDGLAGCFESDEQRMRHLTQIAEAINLYYENDTGEPCPICKEEILDVEIYTKESGWYTPRDFDVKFCPYCGRKL
jgi:hypothetical protein